MKHRPSPFKFVGENQTRQDLDLRQVVYALHVLLFSESSVCPYSQASVEKKVHQHLCENLVQTRPCIHVYPCTVQIMNMSGVSIGVGLSTGAETLFTQVTPLCIHTGSSPRSYLLIWHFADIWLQKLQKGWNGAPKRYGPHTPLCKRLVVHNTLELCICTQGF